MFMSSAEYRESLRRYSPRVFLKGEAVDSVADDPRLGPGIAAIGVSYDFARDPAHAPLMRAAANGGTVPRMLAIDTTSADLLYKLEAVRLLCRRCGCAQRYLSHDCLNAAFEACSVDAKMIAIGVPRTAAGAPQPPRALSLRHTAYPRPNLPPIPMAACFMPGTSTMQ